MFSTALSFASVVSSNITPIIRLQESFIFRESLKATKTSGTYFLLKLFITGTAPPCLVCFCRNGLMESTISRLCPALRIQVTRSFIYSLRASCPPKDKPTCHEVPSPESNFSLAFLCFFLFDMVHTSVPSSPI